MPGRLDYGKLSPEAVQGLVEIEEYVLSSGFDKRLYHLIKLRASQINGCAFCVDMHTKDARKAGETSQRLFGLSVWRETTYYTPREKAALAYTEALTEIAENDVGDKLYDKVREYFNEEELMALTMGILAINSWNRLAIPFGADVGAHKA